VGEVLALTADPAGVGVEVPGRDGPSDATDEVRGPGQVLDGPGGLHALDARGLGLEEHVEAKAWDAGIAEEEDQGVRRQLQVALQAPTLEAPSCCLDVDQGLPLLQQIDAPAKGEVEQLTGLGIGEIDLERLLDGK
jgi:hypothetical protein